MIPAAVRLRGADERRGGAQRARCEHGDDAKIMAGGQSLLPVLRMRLNAPELVIDLGRIDSLRGVRDDGDAIVDRRAHHALRDGHRRPGAGSTPCCCRRRRPRWRTTRSGTAGTFGGLVRPRRPGRRHGRGGAGSRRGVRDRRLGWHPHRGGRRTSSSTSSRPRIGEDEILTEIRVPKHTGWGAHYEKFVRVAAPVADRRGRGDGEGRRAARSARREVGLTNMGSTPLRASRHRGGTRRSAATEDGVRAAADQAADGTQPAERPERRLRLPQAPRDRADPSRRAEGRRAPRPWTSNTASPSPSASRRPGRTSRTSRRSPSASRARW